LDSFKPAPGHYLADKFLLEMIKVRKRYPQCIIWVRWIPGHKDVQGNKAADEEAKKAAADGLSPDAILPGFLRGSADLPYSKSAFKQKFYAELKAKNSQTFAKSPHCNLLRQIDKSAPSKAYQDLVQDILRRHASILELRTSHVPLNKHLHCIGCVDSPTCPACEGGYESVLHFLVTCPAHEPFCRSTVMDGPLHHSNGSR